MDKWRSDKTQQEIIHQSGILRYRRGYRPASQTKTIKLHFLLSSILIVPISTNSSHLLPSLERLSGKCLQMILNVRCWHNWYRYYSVFMNYFLCRINVKIAVTITYCLILKMFDYGKYHCRNRGTDSRSCIQWGAKFFSGNQQAIPAPDLPDTLSMLNALEVLEDNCFPTICNGLDRRFLEWSSGFQLAEMSGRNFCELTLVRVKDMHNLYVNLCATNKDIFSESS